MVEIITAAVTHVIVGGIAANLLLIMSLASIAMGGEGSQISRERRLPQDSDSQVFVILFVAGAVCGLVAAFVSGFSADPLFLVPTGAVAFLVGLFIAFPRVKKLNEAYLQRAAQNVDAGNYREALEDAREVARSSERLRARANEIIEYCQEMRRSQPLDGLSVG